MTGALEALDCDMAEEISRQVFVMMLKCPSLTRWSLVFISTKVATRLFCRLGTAYIINS